MLWDFGLSISYESNARSTSTSVIPFAGIKCPNLPGAFLTTEQALLTNKLKCFITRGKVQRKGKLPISLMLGSGRKEMHFFFSLEFGFLGFSHKQDNKYKLPQDTFKEKSYLQRLAVAIQFE